MGRKQEKKIVEVLWRTANEVLEGRCNVERLPTYTPVDELIGGGIERGEVVEFYGEYGSGKTQICFTLSCTTTGHVYFVDSERTFKPERLAEITVTRGIDSLLSRIHLFQSCTSEEMMETINQIPEDVDVSLVIVDSLTALFRAEYIGRATLTERQGLLRVFIRNLKRYAREHNVAVVLTHQIYANPASSSFLPLEYRELAVGGHTVYHAIGNRFFLRKARRGTRIAKLMDSSMYPPGERPFVTTEKGVKPLKGDRTKGGV